MTIEVFFSSVSGNTKVKKSTESIFQYLEARKIAHTKVDLSLAENEEQKSLLIKLKGSVEIPSVFVNGKYKGGVDEFDNACEDGTDKTFFGIQ